MKDGISVAKVSIDENTGEKSITAIYEFGQDSEIDPFTTSSTKDELNGWEEMYRLLIQ